uniref:Uncharacterized protein n=1 Tax=Physcomitrium patens TaxID=3218 RepID=A0A2K1IC83_PHYPA|nr:hypothetical protein PHYPA_030355 [Physcomitrium patens]
MRASGATREVVEKSLTHSGIRGIFFALIPASDLCQCVEHLTAGDYSSLHIRVVGICLRALKNLVTILRTSIFGLFSYQSKQPERLSSNEWFIEDDVWN